MSNQSWPGVSSLVLNEPLLWEKGRPGRVGMSLPESDVPAAPYEAEGMVRTDLNLPDLAELDVVRHYTRLSTWNFGVDTGMYPLGSCTMKYNPKINEKIAALPLPARWAVYEVAVFAFLFMGRFLGGDSFLYARF